MSNIELRGGFDPRIANYAGTGLLAFRDITSAVSDASGIEESAMFDAPVVGLFNGELGDSQLDVSNFPAAYDAAHTNRRTQGEATLVAVKNDLTAPGLNFVFGMTSPAFRTTIISPARIEASTRDDNLVDASFRTIARHEMGHQFGLTNLASDTDADPLHDGHCGEQACTMRQVYSAVELYRLTERQAGLEGAELFCGDCSEELALSAIRRAARLQEIDLSQ